MVTLHYNQPVKPREMQVLEILRDRMRLPAASVRRLRNLEKGFTGEVRFSELLKAQLGSDCIVLYDLLLERDGDTFQIDCVVIQQRDVWHLEVKNYEGDFQLRDRALYSLTSENEIKNPLNQLDRGRFLLNQLLDRLGYSLSLQSHVVFVHPQFTLFQSKPLKEIIHPTQIQRFLHSVSNKHSQLTSGHRELADSLFHAQKVETLGRGLPEYAWEDLQKGVRCLECDGFMCGGGLRIHCAACGYTEGRESAVVRSVLEFHMLFPDEKITTRRIWEWCAFDRSERTMKRILNQYLFAAGERRHQHFTFW